MFVGFASRDNSYSLEILIFQFKNFIAVKKSFLDFTLNLFTSSCHPKERGISVSPSVKMVF